MRLACERAHRQPMKDQQYESFTPTQEGDCPEFLVRERLGGGDAGADVVFQEGRKRGRGKRHNSHVAPRASYPGSEELFGSIFGKQKHPHRKGGILARHGIGDKPDPIKSSAPDLMVSRHVRSGKDIKKREQ
jgi:hypothetical protein